MSEFINTADVIGDDEMCDQIIQRTVTEYKENRITKVGRYAFYGCNQLETVDVPNATTIELCAFGGCTTLKTVNFPNVTYVGANAFCLNANSPTQIETLYLPAATVIDNGAFRANYHLKRVVLPSLTTLGGEAFQWVSKIEYADLGMLKAFNKSQTLIHCAASLKSLLLRSDSLCTWTLSQALGIGTQTYIYVPKALIEDYKVATNWSVYADQFRALEDYTVDGTTTGELDETKI